MKTYCTAYQSEIGLIEVTATSNAIVTVNFVDTKSRLDEDIPPILKACIQQLDEYFEGKRISFGLALAFSGTEFQKMVWQALTTIAFGETTSYAKIAQQVNNPKAYRAVGNANNKNPIPIIVPCHRVIGSTGKLTGYGGGLWRKEWLLKHEKRILGHWQF